MPNHDTHTESDRVVRGDLNAAPVATTYDEATPITVTSYGLNHPKAYLGYTLAVAQTHGTVDAADDITEEYVVGDTNNARRGAATLNLIQPTGRRMYELTDRGEIVATRAANLYDGVDGALDSLATLKGTHKRFVDLAEKWRSIGPYIAFGDPSIAYLVPMIQDLHRERGVDEFALPELVEGLLEKDAAFTTEFFFTDQQAVRDILSGDTGIPDDVLADADAYRSPVTYQVKTMLYHLGVLTERGHDSASLDPETDFWAVTEQVRSADE